MVWKRYKSKFSNVVASWKNEYNGLADVNEQGDTFVFHHNKKGSPNDFYFKSKSEALSFAKMWLSEND